MRTALTIILLLISHFTDAQSKPSESQKPPQSYTKSVALLSVFLTENVRGEEKKVEAIYEWITQNIEYDYDALTKGKISYLADPKQTLKTKKAISYEYVELMRAMLEYVKIESETVEGYLHDMHWFPGKMVLEEGHTWLAVKINGEWKFVDPTWDAGYIGRIPKKEKEYKAKKYLINKWKKPAKEEKVLKKREEKDLERRKKFDEKPKYTNQIGFVSDPQKEYFLIHRDTFLLTHAPTLPMWQLRKKAITLESFSKSEDSLIMDIEANKGIEVDFKKEIGAYRDQEFVDQLLVCAEDGYDYNPNNPWLKVKYYYTYMAIIHDKKLQKLARGTEFEITESKYPELAAHTDTILKYGKLYKTVEKENYKSEKEFDKLQYQSSVNRDKENTKLTKKVASDYEKMGDKLKTNSNTLEKNLDRLNSLTQKIQKDYEKAIDYKMPEDLDTLVIMPWITAIREKAGKIDQRAAELFALRDNSAFNTLLQDVNYINNLLFYNEQYIRFNSYSTAEWVAEVDSIIKQESNHFIHIMKDSVPRELLDKEMMEELRVIEEICKTAKAELNQMSAEGKLKFPHKYELYLQAIYFEAIKKSRQAHLQSLNFNSEVVKALNSRKATTNQMESRMKAQEDLKKKNYEYIANMTEKAHDRNIDYLEIIEKAAKAWKNKYNGKTN
jgi:Transglutaminase-like superfamily